VPERARPISIDEHQRLRPAKASAQLRNATERLIAKRPWRGQLAATAPPFKGCKHRRSLLDYSLPATCGRAWCHSLKAL
jgi:hypothetical protein